MVRTDPRAWLPAPISAARLSRFRSIRRRGQSGTAVNRVSLGIYACFHRSGNLRNNVRPADETPVLLYSAAKRNLLTDLRARRAGQRQPRSIGLDSNNLGTSGGTSDVDHEHFVLRKLRDLGLLAIRSLNTQQTA